MDKRIRIATTGTYPDGMASTRRIHCYAKGLYKHCIPVEVVSTKSATKYPGPTFNHRANFEGIPYIILWNKNSHKSKWIAYGWAELSSYVLLFHSIFTARRYDVLWLYGMGLIPRLLLLPILHLLGKKVLLELNEYPYSTEGNKLTRIGLIKGILKAATLRWVMPQMDGIVVISENLKEVVKRHAGNVPVIKVPILIEADRTLALLDSTAMKKSPHPHPYIFHAGSLSIQKDGIISVIQAYAKAAVELKKVSVRLDFVLTNNKTSPSVWKEIERILAENNLLKQLKVTGYLSTSDLHHYLQNASVLIINKPSTFQNRFNFPTKLGDYLLSGRPVIIASERVELNKYLTNNVNCIVALPDDVQGISEALLKNVVNSDFGNKIGSLGRQTALSQFDYLVNSTIIIDFLRVLFPLQRSN